MAQYRYTLQHHYNLRLLQKLSLILLISINTALNYDIYDKTEKVTFSRSHCAHAYHRQSITQQRLSKYNNT